MAAYILSRKKIRQEKGKRRGSKNEKGKEAWEGEDC